MARKNHFVVAEYNFADTRWTHAVFAADDFRLTGNGVRNVIRVASRKASVITDVTGRTFTMHRDRSLTLLEN